MGCGWCRRCGPPTRLCWASCCVVVCRPIRATTLANPLSTWHAGGVIPNCCGSWCKPVVVSKSRTTLDGHPSTTPAGRPNPTFPSWKLSSMPTNDSCTLWTAVVPLPCRTSNEITGASGLAFLNPKRMSIGNHATSKRTEKRVSPLLWRKHPIHGPSRTQHKPLLSK